MGTEMEMRPTLIELVSLPYEHDCRKHELHFCPEMWAEEKINNMTNVELLVAISNALEEMK